MSSASPAPARSRSKRGFTLLEMVMVLALIGLAMGGAFTLFISTSAERQLKSISSDLELMAKRARATAMVQQTPYAITFFDQSARLSPLAEASYTPEQLRARLDQEEMATRAGMQAPKFQPVRDSLTFRSFDLSIRRWGSINWVPMLRNPPQVWRFDPNGICEPMGVKVEYDDGWMEMEFHPLTATIRDRMMEAKR